MHSREQLETKVRKIMEQQISPLLRAHGGDVELHQITPAGVARVKLTGACSTCPGAQHTLTEIVASELKEHCPEIQEVIAIGGVSDELWAEAKKILLSRRKSNG